jgi:hypothetical protein
MAPKIQKQIKDMEVGERGYTVPWALDCEHIVKRDLTLNLVVRGDYSVYEKAEGTIKMQIARTKDGITVIGASVRDYTFRFSGKPMMRAWHPLPVKWVGY